MWWTSWVIGTLETMNMSTSTSQFLWVAVKFLMSSMSLKQVSILATKKTDSIAGHMTCLYDGLLLATSEALIEDFPMKLMNVWINAQQREYHWDFDKKQGVYRWSFMAERNAGIATAMVFATLIWSLFLYISLSLSPARESQEGITAWQGWGLRMTILGYVLLAASIFLFFFAHLQFVNAQSPFMSDTDQNTKYLGMFKILLPLSGLSLLGSSMLWWWSHREHTRLNVMPVRREKPSEHEEPDGEDLESGDCSGSSTLGQFDLLIAADVRLAPDLTLLSHPIVPMQYEQPATNTIGASGCASAADDEVIIGWQDKPAASEEESQILEAVGTEHTGLDVMLRDVNSVLICTTVGCGRPPWNGEHGQACCRTCGHSRCCGHGPECEQKALGSV